MIEQFATEHQNISMAGYYCSVISCAVEKDFGDGDDDPDEY